MRGRQEPCETLVRSHLLGRTPAAGRLYYWSRLTRFLDHTAVIVGPGTLLLT